jgi:hypothetical protein
MAIINKWTVFGGLILVALSSYYALPRGIRNNNAGNIRFNAGNDWQGQTGKDSAGFVTFSSAKYGLRAAAKLLINYQNNANLNTIEQIISRWAPTTENNTSAYIDSVAARVGLAPYEYVNLSDSTVLVDMLKSIVKHENGINPYSDNQFNTAVLLARA